MRRNYSNVLLVLSILFVSACSKDSVSEIKRDNNDNHTFYKSSVLYNKASQSRSEEFSYPFEIIKTEIVGYMLYISVSSIKGCEDSNYEIIWDGVINFSYPKTICLFLKRSANNCPSFGDIEYITLSIDLKESTGIETLTDTRIIVSNASKKPNESNSDLTITYSENK